MNFKANGQAQQDRFVLEMLNYKKNGIFLEIGTMDPIKINNTYLLEKDFGWKGFLFEKDAKWLPQYKKHRPNSIPTIGDAVTVDYKSLLQKNNTSSNIDYLQIDLEAANGSSLFVLQNLDKNVMDDYTFSVVTFEHDIYTSNRHNIRKLSREIFERRGYYRVFDDIHNTEPKYVYEDWYINPNFVDMDKVKTIQANNKNNYVPNGITGKSIGWDMIQY